MEEQARARLLMTIPGCRLNSEIEKETIRPRGRQLRGTTPVLYSQRGFGVILVFNPLKVSFTYSCPEKSIRTCTNLQIILSRLGRLNTKKYIRSEPVKGVKEG